MKYVPALDGLRAVAILGVLVFHMLPGRLEGGFTGVDVFFVLSGYLIASIILHDIRDGDFSMREFYFRRIQRLLPNAVAMVFVTVAVSLVALLPSAAPKVAHHGLWTLFNLSNFYIWQNVGGYWDDAAASFPLLHTWSLAVEEQFYLLFPATLWFFSRRSRPRIFTMTAGLALASFALSAYGAGIHAKATFYLLPTRAWEPLLGALLAAYMVPVTADRPLRRIAPSLATEVAGWAGLAMIVAGFLIITDSRGFPGVAALLPTVGAFAVLVSIAGGETSAARLLANPFMVTVGKLSYSLYLWHWPFIVIGRTYAELTGRSLQLGTLVGASVGVVLATIAYLAVEQPMRRRVAGRKRRLLGLAAGFFLCVIASLIISLRHPVPDSRGVFDRPTLQFQLYNAAGDGTFTSMMNTTRFLDVAFPPPQPHSTELWKRGGIVHDWGHQPPRVVVLGSSHALMYGRLIDGICRRLGVSVAFLTANGTAAFFDTGINSTFLSLETARDFDAARLKWLREWKPDLVIAIDRWDVRRNGRSPADFDRQLREFVGTLEPHTRRIVLFSQVPVLRLGQDVNLREFVTWQLKLTGSLPRITPDPGESLRRSTNSAMEAVARDHPKLQLLRVDQPFYLADGSVRYSSGRSFFYADDDHLSDAGTELLREVCTRAIVAGLAQAGSAGTRAVPGHRSPAGAEASSAVPER